jgi:multidrug efflux pump subunit AcrA (membrane-fusion protein)
MDSMNRETSFHSSDTLVVVDRSRRRRQLIIAAAIAAILLIIVLIAVFARGGSDEAAKKAAAGAGQIPTVSVIVPGRTSVGRVVAASGPLAAKREQPIGVAGTGGRVVQVLVDAGSWVRAGQTLAVVDRSVQAQQANQLAAQVEAARANAALAQSNYDRAIALQGRRFASLRRNSPARAPKSGG